MGEFVDSALNMTLQDQFERQGPGYLENRPPRLSPNAIRDLIHDLAAAAAARAPKDATQTHLSRLQARKQLDEALLMTVAYLAEALTLLDPGGSNWQQGWAYLINQIESDQTSQEAENNA